MCKIKKKGNIKRKVIYETDTKETPQEKKCRTCMKTNLQTLIKGDEEEENRRIMRRNSNESDEFKTEIIYKNNIEEGTRETKTKDTEIPITEIDCIDAILAQLHENKLANLPELNEEDLAFLEELL